MRKKTLEDFSREELAGRRVAMRADLNVPLTDGRVDDDTRIEAVIPTLRTLIDAGARTVVLSHLGRPDGAPDPALSLRPVADRLADLLGHPVDFHEGLADPAARDAAEGVEPGGILLFENTRFHPGETTGDPDLARALAAYGELFVNDAFGAAHRAHASTTGIAAAIREGGGEAVAGHLMARELSFLGRTLGDPARPFVTVLGGAKISGKIDVIEALLPRVDTLLVGGAMANTFFRALGLETGDSLVEEDRVEVAREILEKGGERIVLPVDCVVAEELTSDAIPRNVPRDEVRPGDRIGDIGPRSRALFNDILADARTILWNGPLGIFELDPFAEGTLAVARAVADSTDDHGGTGALSVLGGGDSAAAARKAGVADRLSHISTGGGASLEFLAGGELPGVHALSDYDGAHG